MTRDEEGPFQVSLDSAVAAARNGDRSALERLLVHCERVLRRRIERHMPKILRARCAPSDVVQQALLEAVRDFASFRGNGFGELMEWLNRIQQNTVGDLMRNAVASKRDAHREILADEKIILAGLWDRLEDGRISPEEEATRREQSAFVQQRLAALPERMRNAIRLRFREHLTYSVIGKRMGCSEDAARMLCRRAVSTLKSSARADYATPASRLASIGYIVIDDMNSR
jgi:RNA polymerase sigma-70 factor (ECF subfamily)